MQGVWEVKGDWVEKLIEVSGAKSSSPQANQPPSASFSVESLDSFLTTTLPIEDSSEFTRESVGKAENLLGVCYQCYLLSGNKGVHINCPENSTGRLGKWFIVIQTCLLCEQ
jgi:hypothetical protein